MVSRQGSIIACLLALCLLAPFPAQAQQDLGVEGFVDANNDERPGDRFNISLEQYSEEADPNDPFSIVTASDGRPGRGLLGFTVDYRVREVDNIEFQLTNGTFLPCREGRLTVWESSVTAITRASSQVSGPGEIECRTYENGTVSCSSGYPITLSDGVNYILGCSASPNLPMETVPVPLGIPGGLGLGDPVQVTISVTDNGVPSTSAPAEIAGLRPQFPVCVVDTLGEMIGPDNPAVFSGGRTQTSGSFAMLDRQNEDTSDPEDPGCVGGPVDPAPLTDTFLLTGSPPVVTYSVSGRNQPAIQQVESNGEIVAHEQEDGGWKFEAQVRAVDVRVELTGEDDVQPGIFAAFADFQYEPWFVNDDADPTDVFGRQPFGRWVDDRATEPCEVDETTLCLNRFRFRAEIEWTDHAGESGLGQVVPWASRDSGLYWFFDEANVEMVLKVLDGCWLNDTYWVYAGGLTDVATSLVITDTLTGVERQYTNPLGVAFQPIADTAAFPTCFEDEKSSGAPDAAGVVGWLNDALAGQVEAIVHARPSTLARRAGKAVVPQSSCVADSETACLQGERFAVSATWTTTQGDTGAARAVRLTADTAYLWFFDENNIEVVIKVLDGCGLNQRFWVFAGALTDVEVQLRIEDTLTGEVKTYVNPLGTSFQPVTDTDAFGGCR